MNQAVPPRPIAPASSRAARGIRAVAGPVAVLAWSALLVIGCATAPRPVVQPKVSPAEDAVSQALPFLEIASPQSLSETARLLAAGSMATPSTDAPGSASIASLVSLGNSLFLQLYPEMSDPFPQDTPPPADGGVGASVFFAHVVPALVLLDPQAPIDETQAPGLSALLGFAERENPHSVLPPYLMGILLDRQRETISAREMYEECLRRAPSFYPAGSRLAALLIASGHAADELPLLEELAALLPLASQRFAALARAYLAAGEPQKAADAAAQGLLVAPEDTGFVLLRARAFEAQTDWYQSLRLLDALLKLKPDERPAILMKARLLHEKAKNSQEAIRILLDAEERFPADADFPELHGRILIETHRTDEGIAMLTRALSLAPGRLSLLTQLLRQAVQGQRWNQASAWLGEIPARRWTPEHYELGWQVATSLGEHARAIDYAQRLELMAGGAKPLALEARSLVAVGRPEQARLVVDHALLAMQAEPSLRAELLVIRSTAGSEDPLRDLRSALLEDPQNVEALTGISDVLAKGHEYRKALDYAKQAAALSPGNASLAQKVIDLGKLSESRK